MGNRVHRRSASSYLLLSVGSFVGAAGLVFAYFVLPRFSGHWLFSLLLILFGIVCVGPVWLRWRRGRLDLFEPPVTMSLLYFFLFGVCSIPYVSGRLGQYEVRGLPVDISWMTRSLFFLIFGILALWIGYECQAAMWLERRLGIKSSVRSSTDRRGEVSLFWVTGLWLVGWISRVYQLRMGIAGYLKAQYRDVAAAHVGSAQVLSLVASFSRYALVLALLAVLANRRDRFKPGVGLMFGIMLSMELIINIVSGYRAFSLWTFLYMAVAYYYTRRRFPMGLVVAGILLFLFIFALIPLYRQAIVEAEVDTRDTLSLLSLLVSLPEDLGGRESIFNAPVALIRGAELFFLKAGRLQHMAVAVLWADRFGAFPYKYDILLLPLLAFVPRFIWPGKPVRDMGAWFYNQVMGRGSTTAMAITYPGALYLAYGFWGFLIGMFLTGILQRFTYRRYAHSKSLATIFLAPFLWRSLLLGSDFVGSLVNLIRQVIVLLVIRRLVFGQITPKQGAQVGAAKSSSSISTSTN